MADSIPSLRRKNKELSDKVAELEAKLSDRVVEYIDVVREVAVEVPVVQQGSPVLVGVPAPYAVETVREVSFPVDVLVESKSEPVMVGVPAPYSVETVREVAFPVDVPVSTPVYYTKEIPVDKIVYVDNPVHLEMIASLQCKIRELMAGRYD